MPPLAVARGRRRSSASASQLEPSEEIAELCARLDIAATRRRARRRAHEGAHAGADPRAPLAPPRPAQGRPRRRSPPADAESDDRVVATSSSHPTSNSSSPASPSSPAAAPSKPPRRSADADLDTLQSLVEKSLLRFTDERYWMLETIREYASERLRGTRETADGYVASCSGLCWRLAGRHESMTDGRHERVENGSITETSATIRAAAMAAGSREGERSLDGSGCELVERCGSTRGASAKG